MVFKELRLIGALDVDVDAYRPALEALLRTMAGDTGDAPPVHGVLVP